MTFKQTWYTFFKCHRIIFCWHSFMTEVFGHSKSQIKSGLKPEKLPPLLPWVSFLRLVVAPPLLTFLSPLAGNRKSKNWTSVPAGKLPSRTRNGRDHTTVPFTSWTDPFHWEGGVNWGQTQDRFSRFSFSCSHSGNSSKLSTRLGRVTLLKVTGGIWGQDWVLTHYSMMIRGKSDGNSEMQSFHNAARKEANEEGMKSVMTEAQLTLLLLNPIYNL